MCMYTLTRASTHMETRGQYQGCNLYMHLFLYKQGFKELGADGLGQNGWLVSDLQAFSCLCP